MGRSTKANGAQSALWAEINRQMTKIRVRRILRAMRLSDSTNERQEIISLIGWYFADVGVDSDFRWCWRTKRVFTKYNLFLRYVVVSAWDGGVFTNNNWFPRHVPNHGRRHRGGGGGGGTRVLGPTTFEIRWGRTHQIREWSGPRPYIGGSHPAILPNRDVTHDASGAQNPSSLSKPLKMAHLQQAMREILKR